jgi:hypothetical protein
MSFEYQPRLFLGNKWAKNTIDGFSFSGTEIASAGQPIVASMSGTVYSGGTGSYGADGNIYGGAMSSSSGAATTGRPPQIGRNSIIGPGFNNLDFRVARDIPIYEKLHMQLIAEAFNLANHTIVTGVNSTYSQYSAISGSSSAACQTAAPAGSVLQGCITPYSGTGTSAFGATSSTNNTLYGPRQLQFQARMSF